MADKYDVGILGVWYGCNYGSIATYYALYSIIKDMGKSVLMVHRPWIAPFNEEGMEKRHSMKFARSHYDISKAYHVDDIHELNDLCDSFVLGSDQLWNYGVTKAFGHSYFLDFADDDKRKIAYSTSFGSDRFTAPWSFTWKTMHCMRRMNYVSVREEVNVKMCQKLFGVHAKHVLDPVLLGKTEYLSGIADESKREVKSNYIAAYILDPTKEKREALLYMADKLGKDLVIMLDGWPHLFKKNKEKMQMDECVISDVDVKDWLFYMKHSDFVITDSFHGTCIAILFEKQFYALANPGRGAARFESLMKDFDLFANYVHDPLQVTQQDVIPEVDYTAVNEKLTVYRAESMRWLEDAVCSEEQNHSVIDKSQRLYPLRLLKSIGIYVGKNSKIVRRLLGRA